MPNLKFALRTLFKTPFVTIVAIVSLALGIGANAAMFSLFNQILLRALPVADAGRLVNLAAPGPKPGMNSCSQAGDCDTVLSYAMFRDLERAQTVFSGIAGLIAIAFLMRWLQIAGFGIFALYRLIFGAVLLYFVYGRGL